MDGSGKSSYIDAALRRDRAGLASGEGSSNFVPAHKLSRLDSLKN
jgi:hypothetical protein